MRERRTPSASAGRRRTRRASSSWTAAPGVAQCSGSTASLNAHDPAGQLVGGRAEHRRRREDDDDVVACPARGSGPRSCRLDGLALVRRGARDQRRGGAPAARGDPHRPGIEHDDLVARPLVVVVAPDSVRVGGRAIRRPVNVAARGSPRNFSSSCRVVAPRSASSRPPGTVPHVEQSEDLGPGDGAGPAPATNRSGDVSPVLEDRERRQPVAHDGPPEAPAGVPAVLRLPQPAAC